MGQIRDALGADFLEIGDVINAGGGLAASQRLSTATPVEQQPGATLRLHLFSAKSRIGIDIRA